MAPSLTAQGVARARARMARPSTIEGDPDGEARLSIDLGAEPRGEPGPLFHHLAARTMFFDDLVLEAVATPTTQIVVVGAGYDCRALRFRREGVRFFELDLPETQRDKRARLTRLGIATPDVVYVAIDLARRDVGAALAAAGHDAARRTLFVCEGLLLYLDGAVIERVFRGLRRRAGDAGTLALSIAVDRGGSDATVAARRDSWDERLRSIGEPPRTRLPVEEWEALLAATGWRIECAIAPHDLDPEVAAGGALLVTAVPADPRPA